MAKLTGGSTIVDLSDDFLWEDEFSWDPVEQNVSRTLTGALIIDTSVIENGRPITLRPPDDQSAWMNYEDLLKLNSLAAIPALIMQLEFRGVTRDVMFRHHERPAVLPNAVVFYRDPDPSDPHLVIIKLMEV